MLEVNMVAFWKVRITKQPKVIFFVTVYTKPQVSWSPFQNSPKAASFSNLCLQKSSVLPSVIDYSLIHITPNELNILLSRNINLKNKYCYQTLENKQFRFPIVSRVEQFTYYFPFQQLLKYMVWIFRCILFQSYYTTNVHRFFEKLLWCPSNQPKNITKET